MRERIEMDWGQVRLNGGPPCFHVEGPQFCGRAERWYGHGNTAFHDFVSLNDFLARAEGDAHERARRAAKENGRLREALQIADKEASVAHDAIWAQEVKSVGILHDNDRSDSAQSAIWRLHTAVRAALDAAIAEKDAEMAVLREAHNAEADEFNAGFEAYQAGLPEDTPREDPHDVWLCGYAWAAYEDLKRDLAVLREENERMKSCIRDAEEREAAVCPEDLGFDEYIRHLEKAIALRDTARLLLAGEREAGKE